MNVQFAKTSSGMGVKKLSETQLLTSDDLIIQEHLQWFQTLSLIYSTQLLTPDDLIIQEHIARKYRCKMTPKQSERRQLQILSPLKK